MDERLDGLVIGGGPAGLTATIYLARFHRRLRLIDAARSRCAWVPVSHNHPGFPDGVGGEELLDRLREQARRHGVVVESGTVRSLEPDEDGFLAETADGGSVRAAHVVLATGVIDGQPQLPDLGDAVGRGLIRVCPICDAFEVTDHRIGVLGHGRDAIGEALFLRSFSDDVTVLALGEPLVPTPAEQDRLDATGVRMAETPVTAVRVEGGRSAEVVLADGQTLTFDTLYSALGTLARTDLAARLGARMDADGRLFVDAHQETSVPGLFAAGDAVVGLNQISVAMGQAAVAATAIHNRLRAREGMSRP